MGIPPDHVEVEVVINKDGKYEAKIVGHGPEMSCLDENDKALLGDFIGFEVESFGKTDEYFTQTQPNENQLPDKQLEESTPDKDEGLKA